MRRSHQRKKEIPRSLRGSAHVVLQITSWCLPLYVICEDVENHSL